MISHISKKIACSLSRNGAIDCEDRDVYAYGFEVLLSTVLNFVAICVFAIAFGIVPETVCYLLAFVPLRTIAGGYHAKNHGRCFLVLMMVYIAAMVLTRITPTTHIGILGIFFVVGSSVIVFLLAPVSDSNNPLQVSQKNSLRRKSRVVAITYAFVIVLLFIFVVRNNLVFAAALGTLTGSLSLLAGKIKEVVTECRQPLNGMVTENRKEVPQA